MSTQEKSDKTNQVQEPTAMGTYTAVDYLSWKTDELMELIRGKVFKMSAAPARRHQRVSGKINLVLEGYFEQPCEVYYAPFDVYLVHPGENWAETKNIVQPDLCVICDSSKLVDPGCAGAPDLIVEILSPGTAAKDLGPKRDLYEEYGVKELWIVHPAVGTIALHVLENGKYRILPLLAKGQILKSPTFPDLQFNLDEAFPEDIEIG